MKLVLNKNWNMINNIWEFWGLVRQHMKNCLFSSAIVIMEYGASLTYEDQIIDMEDPNFLVPKAAGGNNRSTTPLSQESTDSCHNNEAFEKGKLYLKPNYFKK